MELLGKQNYRNMSSPNLYRASVFDIDDPERRGRVRLLVPQVLGESPSGWAEPTFPGESAQYRIHDRMWVLFEGGDVNRPTYISRMRVRTEDITPGAVTLESLSDDFEFPPGTTTDGEPPDDSPTPITSPLTEAILLRWEPTVNADLVLYQVHMDDSSGVVPGAGTFYGHTTANTMIVNQMPNGTDLNDTDTYFFRIVALDADGAAPAGTEVSGVPGKIEGTWIQDGTIQGHNIADFALAITHFTSREHHIY
jgi:hypothetical protein